jgi:serine/threonine protein kinase
LTDPSHGDDGASGASSAPASGTTGAASGTEAKTPGGNRKSEGPDPLIGRVINDRFRVVAQVARGGMGKVYRAEQAPLGREVALKILNPNYNGDQDPEFHKRFFLEASTCSKLTHPNTVTIFDYGRTDDDVYFIAMELLEGRTLHRAIRDDGPFPPARALHVARQIARSLREAHVMGVVHRDLKPANVYLVKHGDEVDFVKVLDFGLVKNVAETGEDLTQTGLFMGSPKYMAPEQIRGEKTDARSDIYALGVILYEMLTGKVPFDRSSSVNILMAHVHEAPPPFVTVNPSLANPSLAVPVALEMLVMKALSKNADDRFASMDELLVAMKHVTTDSGQSTLSQSTGQSLEMGMTGRFSASGPDLRTSGELRVSSTSSSGPVMLPPGSSGSTVIPGAPRTPSGVLSASVAPSGPQTSELASPDAQSADQRNRLLAALGVGLVLLLGLGFYAFGRGDTEVVTPTTLPETTGSGSGASGPREPPPPEPVLTTLVTLRSTPTGALVRVSEEGHEGSTTYGPTPADVEWSGEEATRGREVTFVFELDGYQPYSVTRTVGGDTLAVSAELLEAARAGRPYRPRPPRRPEGDDDSGHLGPVKGYKTDPY